MTTTRTLHRFPAAVGALLAALVAALTIAPNPTTSAASAFEAVVVQAAGDIERAAAAVLDAGGRVAARIGLVDAVVAEVPANRVEGLASDPRVAAVQPDRTLHVQSSAFDGPGSLTAPDTVRAPDAWAAGYTGAGTGVALVDTGIAEHPDVADRVVAAADLTLEGTFVDSYGHGTFLAGLIAGDGSASGSPVRGTAPGAHLMSVKVAGEDGATTLGQVLYGLQLVDASAPDYNIRIVVLALAGDDRPGPDLLELAVERLWASGLVVVVAAGNGGPDGGSIASPGSDPYVITAGALDDAGTAGHSDDSIPTWSARGPTVDGFAKPDVVAPGTSVVSLRAPGSTIDEAHPQARVGEAYFRGTGTSMATAVVAGAAALLLEAEPDLTPDEVKGRLLGTAAAAPADADPAAAGYGVVDAASALSMPAPAANADLPQLWAGRAGPPIAPGKSAQFGWVEFEEGPDLWGARSWAARSWAARSWAARSWAARSWAARSWAGRSWAARSWAGVDWNARSWAEGDWLNESWSGRSWAGRSWAGRSWAGRSWADAEWSSRSWSSRSWA